MIQSLFPPGDERVRRTEEFVDSRSHGTSSRRRRGRRVWYLVSLGEVGLLETHRI